MPIAQSKVTSQGQISIPAEVRKRLGIGPGSVLEWNEEDGRMTVRRAGLYSSEDIHKKIFGSKPPARRSIAEMDEGIREYILKRYARG